MTYSDIEYGELRGVIWIDLDVNTGKTNNISLVLIGQTVLETMFENDGLATTTDGQRGLRSSEGEGKLNGRVTISKTGLYF